MVHLVLPPLRRTSADAAQFAAAIHAGDTDDAGAALMAHLARVAASVARLVEGCPFWTSDHRDDAIQVAWLHHTLADGKFTARDLQRESFSRIVIDDVAAMTRDSASSYFEWLEDNAHNAHLAAVLVMLADLEENRNSGCAIDGSDSDIFGTETTYEQARSILIEAARLKGWEGDSTYPLSPQ